MFVCLVICIYIDKFRLKLYNCVYKSPIFPNWCNIGMYIFKSSGQSERTCSLARQENVNYAIHLFYLHRPPLPNEIPY